MAMLTTRLPRASAAAACRGSPPNSPTCPAATRLASDQPTLRPATVTMSHWAARAVAGAGARACCRTHRCQSQVKPRAHNRPVTMKSQ